MKCNKKINDKELMSNQIVLQYYEYKYAEYQKFQISFPELKKEKDSIIMRMRNFEFSSVLDIGAGSGFWLSEYYDLLSTYIGIERAKSGCDNIKSVYKKKLDNFFVFNEDVFEFKYKNIPDFNSIILSFFISHFNNETVIELIKNISKAKPYFNNIHIIDSYWSKLRKSKYNDKYLEIRKRTYRDKSQVDIPKRYIDESDLNKIAADLNMHCEYKFLGNYWLYCILWNQ